MKKIITLEYPNGMTVAELKKALAGWPEIDEDGEPTEIWMMTGVSTSSMVTALWPLNVRGDTASIVFSCETE